MNKSQLRKKFAELLNALPEIEEREQSRVVFKKLIEHPRYKSAKRLSIFLSTRNEIDTTPILKHSLEIEGKKCFIPLVRKTAPQNGTRMVMVQLNSMQEYDDLRVNKYGIKEPNESDALQMAEPGSTNDYDLDIIIVPGVAFTPDGRRLGHGKGYYDEFLANWSKRASNSKRLHSIGLAFMEQLIEDLPTVDGHDIKLDEVLTAASS